MDSGSETRTRNTVWFIAILMVLFCGCRQISVPRFDPTGQRIFLPRGNRTSLTLPWPNLLQNRQNNQGLIQLAPSGQAATNPGINSGGQSSPNLTQPGNLFNAPANRSSIPTMPAPGGQNLQPTTPPQFLTTTGPNQNPPCNYQGRIGSCLELKRKARALGVTTGDAGKLFGRGKRGELKMSPARIVAPVGAEVVVLAGICAGDGLFVTGQPIEFNMSQDSVGQMTDFGARERGTLTKLISRRRTSGDFISSRTSLFSEKIDRGTPTVVDDIHVEKGQTWVSVSSPTAGTSYITAVAPDAEAWDKRISTTEIQWVDAHWNIPSPVVVTAGSRYPLSVNIRKTRDGLGVDDWKVIYRIAGGAPAQFLPSGSQKAEVVTGPDGNASVEITQAPDSIQAGTTFVRIDIVRPSGKQGQYQVIESALTSVRWAAAAITLRVIGPKNVGINAPFAQRLEITNPGDQVARDVKIVLDRLPEGLSFTSSNPKARILADRYEWSVGDVAPNSSPKIIDIQLKAKGAVGKAVLCFVASSDVDQKSTKVCTELNVVAPCIGLAIEGPKEAKVGQLAHYKLIFVNQCAKDLEDLTAIVSYGNGLEAPNVSGKLRFGPLKQPLKFKESKTVDLALRVLQEGEQFFRIDVSAAGGERASIGRIVRGTNTNSPSISLQVGNPVTTSVGQFILSRALVTNTGNIPLTGVQVRCDISRSLSSHQAAPEANSNSPGVVTFNLGRIEPGASQPLILQLRGEAIDGNGFVRYTVNNDQRSEDTKQQSIRIERSSQGGSNPGGLSQGGGQPGGGQQPGGISPGGNGQPGGIQQPSTPPISIPGQGGGPVARQLSVKLNLKAPIVRREEIVPAEIVVRNLRNQTDRNLQISILTPPGIQFHRLTSPNLQVNSSPDGTQHTITPIKEIRPGDTIQLGFQFKAVQVGPATIEVSAKTDSSVLPISDDQIVTITQSNF